MKHVCILCFVLNHFSSNRDIFCHFLFSCLGEKVPLKRVAEIVLHMLISQKPVHEAWAWAVSV